VRRFVKDGCVISIEKPMNYIKYFIVSKFCGDTTVDIIIAGWERV